MTTFSPLDLLTVSTDEQLVLRSLNKQPGQTIPEIAAATKLGQPEVAVALDQLLEDGRVVEQLQAGRRVFSVRFGQAARTQVRNMPDALMAIFAEAPETFLEEVPATASLSAEERQELLAAAREKKLLIDEIFAWQGKELNYVGVVKTGLLRRTDLQSNNLGDQTLGFINRCEWLGLVEMLGNAACHETLTAAADTELLLWRRRDFMRLLEKMPRLGIAIGRLLGQELVEQRHFSRHGNSRLWVVDGIQRQVGVTTIANRLSQLVAMDTVTANTRVILWHANGTPSDMLAYFNVDANRLRQSEQGQELLLQLRNGPDLLLQTGDGDLPPPVQLELLLNRLRRQYDYIIADTGTELDAELMLRLRGQADVLITITCDEEGSQQVRERWQQLKQFTAAGQQRFLVLNQAEADSQQATNFHMVLPYEAELPQALNGGHFFIESAGKTPIGEALAELYRRLSLTHSIGIFIPSTLDVNVTVDNGEQVQSALAFLGKVFGGATSSNAEGVWQSNEGSLVTEQVTIVRTFVSQSALNTHLDEVLEFAKIIKREMGQEAVALDIDNQLVLV